MANTLTKPILLDETGVAIKTALNNINDTEAQDWLLSYEDVHSEMDDNVKAIADNTEGLNTSLSDVVSALVDIKDVLNLQGRRAIGITIVTPPDVTTQFAGAKLNLKGMVVCARMSNGIDSILADVTEFCTFSPAAGSTIPDNVETLDVTVSFLPDGSVTPFTTTQTITVDTSVKIVTWSSGTDAEVAAMLQAHYEDKIDIHDYWSVGDERTVHLSAITDTTYANETHVEQDVTMVLMNEGGRQLYVPIGDHTECAFIVGQKDILKNSSIDDEYGRMHNSADPSNPTCWGRTDRREWCHTYYRNALPTIIKNMFKAFLSPNVEAFFIDQQIARVEPETEYFVLPAEAEVTDSPQYSADEEIEALTILKYYEDSSNRNKHGKCWLRTHRPPWSTNAEQYAAIERVNPYSIKPYGLNYSNAGFAPYGVI